MNVYVIVISKNIDVRWFDEQTVWSETKIFKAFCDPNRLKILNILKSWWTLLHVSIEILDVEQSTLSHHQTY